MKYSALFRDSKKKIPNTCRGFFDDYRHLEEQFKSLTDTQGLVGIVDENFTTQIGDYFKIQNSIHNLHLLSGYLELYLKHCIQTVEFSEFLSGVELACNMEYNGSLLYKYIELLVSRSVLILLEIISFLIEKSLSTF